MVPYRAKFRIERLLLRVFSTTICQMNWSCRYGHPTSYWNILIYGSEIKVGALLLYSVFGVYRKRLHKNGDVLASDNAHVCTAGLPCIRCYSAAHTFKVYAIWRTQAIGGSVEIDRMLLRRYSLVCSIWSRRLGLDLSLEMNPAHLKSFLCYSIIIHEV